MPAKFEADPEVVITLAFSLKINAKKMKKMEKEYMTMKTKEKEDEIELRVRTSDQYCNLKGASKEFELKHVTSLLKQWFSFGASIDPTKSPIVSKHECNTN
jgi:hypothetical protein